MTSSDFLRAGWDQEVEEIQEQSSARRCEQSRSALLQQRPAVVTRAARRPSCHGSLFAARGAGEGPESNPWRQLPLPPTPFSACPGLCPGAPTHLHSSQAWQECFLDAKYQQGSQSVRVMHRHTQHPSVSSRAAGTSLGPAAARGTSNPGPPGGSS